MTIDYDHPDYDDGLHETTEAESDTPQAFDEWWDGERTRLGFPTEFGNPPIACRAAFAAGQAAMRDRAVEACVSATSFWLAPHRDFIDAQRAACIDAIEALEVK